MLRWFCFPVLFTALVYGELDCRASEMPRPLNAETMCFEHIGPQDKPMPMFCIIEYGAAPNTMGTSDVPPIQVTSVMWRTLLDLIEKEGLRDLVHPTVFGEYQVRFLPVGRIVYLPTESTLKVVLALVKVEGLNDAQSEMLQRLKLRLRGIAKP